MFPFLFLKFHFAFNQKPVENHCREVTGSSMHHELSRCWHSPGLQASSLLVKVCSDWLPLTIFSVLTYSLLPLHLCLSCFFHCNWSSTFLPIEIPPFSRGRDGWSDSYCPATRSDLWLSLSTHCIHWGPWQIWPTRSHGAHASPCLDCLFVLKKLENSKTNNLTLLN